jgi:Flp pilus assembly protein TadG
MVTQLTAAGAPAHKCAPRRGRGDRGLALVEFAIILPFLSLLVFGVVDLGRAWQLQNRLSNAAREGASVAQFFPTSVAAGCRSGSNATDRATQEDLELSAMDGFAVTVDKIVAGVADPITGCESPSESAASGDMVRVTVRANYHLLTPLVGALTGDPIVASRSVDVVVQG